ncbi:HAD family hydrolase [Paenibacillus sp. JDR-2]|uniref:HAD family hydrolase n=1 Tax=Paenibacillus sp. (strain JDR-2) TaxID=324057 RepID=UPI00016690E7|nr:HAD family hydrolase [Paenibacillus sp. JDR-2]ACT01176.1 HAD-superfamily hydrolase, subfamily IA, variant 1 [Paenibacillus sp. JDR-2]
MNNFAAVIFDLDQTLLDKHQSSIGFANHQYDAYALEAFRIDKGEYIRKFTEMNHVVRPKEEVYKDLVGLFAIDSSLLPVMLEDLNQNFSKYAIGYPGLKEMLSGLKKAAFKLGMITNGRAFYQRDKIRALGIECYFDDIIISEAVGLRKPDPAIFQLSLTNLNVSAAEAVFVGDNLKKDMIPAKELGMKTIWKQMADPNEYADFACDDLSEIPNLIYSFVQTKTG